ncbi:MAG: cytochrome b/b6 domain-containing protein [Acidobacteria bacterium]|nr:cytochrome b/b6 domain-containing protein [Acidobacteriota bacterium]
MTAPFLYRSVASQNKKTPTEAPPAPTAAQDKNKDEKKDPSKTELNCSGCHVPGKTMPNLAGEKFHKDVHNDYDVSYHAKAANNGKKAAHCMDCHTIGGDISTMLPASDPKSTINRMNIAKTCSRCHNDPTLMKDSGTSNQPFLAFQESVHGKALARGNTNAAVCTDCHRSHDILSANEEQSSISKFNIAKTCAKCHGQIATEFTESVHGAALGRGNYQSPNCTDCHGVHSIKSSKNTRNNLGMVGCSQCHSGVRLTQDYGIASDRVASFEDSYHGRAQKLGSDVVADCASCHGVHNILPSSNPKSLINSANLTATCGQCHVGANEKFSEGKVHLNTAAAEDAGSIGINWVRAIYMTLIFVIVGGMLVHNGVIWYRKVSERVKQQDRSIRRMSVNQRVQHWLLLTSFITLVFSGFALLYSDTWLGWLFYSEYARRIIHRVAAVVMMVTGFYHVFYLFFTREGRLWLWDMLPCWKDVVDLYQTAMYYLFMKGEKPKFARFRYADKAEYWAVVWGTILMGLTGLMIWYKVEIFNFLPRWWVDIAIAVHLYEAVLATLAIVVWHFYHVIIDPDVYPINPAFIDGRMSEEMFREEHELAYEEMMEAENEADEDEETDEPADEEPPAKAAEPPAKPEKNKS